MRKLGVAPVGHRVIVQPDDIETKTASGIVLAVNEKREQAAAQKGTVVAVGDMAWKNPAYGYGIDGWKPWVKEGDRVFFARYAGKGFDDNGVYLIVMNDEDIQCLIVNEQVEAKPADDVSA